MGKREAIQSAQLAFDLSADDTAHVVLFPADRLRLQLFAFATECLQTDEVKRDAKVDALSAAAVKLITVPGIPSGETDRQRAAFKSALLAEIERQRVIHIVHGRYIRTAPNRRPRAA